MRFRTVLLCAALGGAAPALAQQGDGTRVGMQVHIFKPAKVEPTAERIAQLGMPAGFSVNVFASGLKNARILAVAPDGTVYLSRRDQGDVLMLKDVDGNGVADAAPVVVANRSGAHGIAVHDGRFYLVTVKELFVADVLPDGRLGPLTLLAGDLPDAGQHPNRTIAFGPDGMLYLSAGSTCNVCNENNPENATILRMAPDGKSRTIFASGLRNTIGFDWNPRTGELWGMDDGIDFLGDDDQPEELNRIEPGRQYGWPHVYADGRLYPQSTPVGNITKEEWKAASTPMVLGWTAHASPMQMVFYRGGTYPREYVGDAFVTMRGSWNRDPSSGYEIVRVHYVDGQARSITPFVTGFLTDGGTTHIARPMGLAVAKDGSLLMADDANGVVYRFAYTQTAPQTVAAAPTRAAAALAPSGPMRKLDVANTGVPLASERGQTRTDGSLRVTSLSIVDGRPMPMRHSAYADDASPQIEWTAVPTAKSYAILLEDPDAKPVYPFVHWLAWNIPAGVTRLPEGLQAQPRLTEPDGVLQGKGTRGSAGYYGPHPPVGDPAHRYVFQVFALDTMLTVPAGADRETLVAAMQGHVLAKGRLTGLYAQDVKPPK